MSFYSATFALFFVGVVSLYYLAPQIRRVSLLLAASLLFYLSFVGKYVCVVLALIVIDYCAARILDRTRSATARKLWLVFGLAMNLGTMAAFKYSLDLFGKSPGVIPIGLSFHTFQGMAYLIEVHRGRQPAERSMAVFALYILFFPQIAAGPIEPPQNMLPQFRKPHLFDYRNVVGGLQLMLWGIFQKYVIADQLAYVVGSIYPNRGLSGPVTAFGLVCFSFQMLCDFAGYSEIALGAAQVMGFRLTRNFNAPFHADSMAEYWKRWHISLSTWMRDYVFFPLCGARPRMPRICASIMMTFLANALWHGARWTFVVSGLLHGTYRLSEVLVGRAISRSGWSVGPAWSGAAKAGRTVLVFSLMTFAFLFFRGESLGQSLNVVARLFSGWGALAHPAGVLAEFHQASISTVTLLGTAGLILLMEAVEWLRSASPLRPRIAALPVWWRWSLYYAAAAAVLLLASRNGGQTFIYFRF